MNKGNTVYMVRCKKSTSCPWFPLTPARATTVPNQSVNWRHPKVSLLAVLVHCALPQRNWSSTCRRGIDVQVFKVISKATEPDTLLLDWNGTCGFRQAYCATVGFTDESCTLPAGAYANGVIELLISRDCWSEIRSGSWASWFSIATNSLRLPHGQSCAVCYGHDAGGGGGQPVDPGPDLPRDVLQGGDDPRVLAGRMRRGRGRNAETSRLRRERDLGVRRRVQRRSTGPRALKVEGWAKMEAVPMFGSLPLARWSLTTSSSTSRTQPRA